MCLDSQWGIGVESQITEWHIPNFQSLLALLLRVGGVLFSNLGSHFTFLILRFHCVRGIMISEC